MIIMYQIVHLNQHFRMHGFSDRSMSMHRQFDQLIFIAHYL